MAPSRAARHTLALCRVRVFNSSRQRPLDRASSRPWISRRHFASTAESSATATATTKATKVSPLQGIRVLDMTRVLAGILGDLGAEVIKIEHPTRGDDTRAWGPPFAKYKPDAAVKGDRPGESAYFIGVNRNKKSVGLSFQHPDGIKILHDLAKTADVLVENYIPGSLKKYQLDYESVRTLNPSLIYASITGYGQYGPYASRAGYDVMVEAEMGLMHITGERDGSPVKVGVAVTDLTTGLYTCNAIMAALLARQQTATGQHLDVSLSDCQVATLANIASSVLVSGERDGGRWGTAHPSIVPYKGFKTRDGDVMLGGGNDRLFGIICDRLGKPEWKSDPRFASNDARVRNRAVLERMIEDVTLTRTTADWLAVLEGSGLPYAAINDVKDTLEHEHVQARGMVTELEHPACGPVKVVSHPVKYSESLAGVRSPPPTLGEHTDQVLREVLGMEAAEVERLRTDGVVA
ncbi:Succinate--hydroxymethylglutarate CoA-transferase [Cladophialophora carrionii]|uniref:Succinate--hydroxymethylglutarate CoA-transferase n=1 Tax=Cladophialophora carrionii TaxID=86049 RepID=A0A1C1CF17_9EURO|nr:Succinate--hydroxymethylglutarate CoA-transferase [Cladophialophora carrionii]